MEPTIYPAKDFNATVDGDALREAMQGLGTNEEEIIRILTSRNNEQRQQIAEYFKNDLERDLVDDLKGELGGNFENCIVALMMSPDQYLCKQLNDAMEGVGTNESILVEILCTKNKEQMKILVDKYEEDYGRPLAEHMCSETDGNFRRLLTLIVTGVRDNDDGADELIDETLAKEQAAALWNAGEAKLGTDEEVFNRIMAHGSFPHLKVVFEEYKQLSGQTIEQAIENEVDDELKDAYMAIVECVQSPAAFFAKSLNKAVDGAGTDDNALIRIIVSRSEIDLGNIKSEYERIYNKTLYSAIKDETSSDYCRALCAIIGDV